jgi:hypothetical protein
MNEFVELTMSASLASFSPSFSLAPILAQRASIAQAMEDLENPSDAVLDSMIDKMSEAEDLALSAPVQSPSDLRAALDYLRSHLTKTDGDVLGLAMIDRIGQFIGIMV